MGSHWISLLSLIGGVILLYLGAEGLIIGARRASIRLGLTPLVAGLTVVALATSLPEAAGSFVAQLRGHSGSVALGNVIGSNIANVGLILGISALVRPIPTSRLMRVREMPIMLGVLALLLWFIAGDRIGRLEGAILVALLIVYLVLQAYWGRKGREAVHLEALKRLPKGIGIICLEWLLILVGAVLLIIGALLLVEGATDLARRLGMSPRLAGLIFVAIGTSLPELATCVVSAARRHADLAMGNIVGSNILNVLFVAGGVALISPITFSSRLVTVDAPVMFLMSLVLWVMLGLRRTISRLEGAILLLLYAGYIVWISLAGASI